MIAKRVVVFDQMQSAYEYTLTERSGRNFHPDFEPQLSPRQMLALGVFGGKYLCDCTDEFPRSWYAKARLSPAGRNPELNLFGVNASKSLGYWRDKGWIYEEDPRGWFQWYCRYYRGRRCPDDDRQTKRWKAMRRHVAQVKKGCEPWDMSCRRKQRQALLHWAYDSREL